MYRADPGGDRRGAAAGGEHRLQRLPARAVPARAGLPGAAPVPAHGRPPGVQQRHHPAVDRRRAIYLAFGGKTAPLIPLYAVGVFLAFTLSQAGMVVHWWRLRGPHWRRSMVFNATGARLSAVVFVTAASPSSPPAAGCRCSPWPASSLSRPASAATTRRCRGRSRSTPVPRASRTPDRAASPSLRPGRGAQERESDPGKDAAGAADEIEESPDEIRHLVLVRSPRLT